MINSIMKQITKTDLGKIESYLHYKNGPEVGNSIFFNFSSKLEELYNISEFNTKKKATVAFKYVLPVIALYRAFKELGMDKNVAITTIKSYFNEFDFKNVNNFSKFINTSFYYTFFDRKIKKYQEQNLPTNEFRVRWEEFNSERVYFDVNKCIYLEILKEYAEEDLLEIFCNREKNMFSQISSKVDFNMPKTILNKDDSCQFRFIKK